MCVYICVYIYMYKVQNLQGIILTPSSLSVTSCHVAEQQLFLESQAQNWCSSEAWDALGTLECLLVEKE